MKDRIKKTQAITLKSIDYRETSKIITAFSEGFGKLQLIAKGVRNPKSRMSAALQTFVKTEIFFYKNETTELYLVKEAALIDFFNNIHHDLTRFHYASVIADFLYSLLAQEQISKTLFQYALFTLHKIDQVQKEELPFILSKFLLKGVALIGFKIELNKCTVCGKEKFSPLYFSHERGGLLCGECKMDDTAAKILRKSLCHLLSGIQENEGGWNSTEINKADFMNASLLFSNWIHYHNHRPLKTLDNFIKGKAFHY